MAPRESPRKPKSEARSANRERALRRGVAKRLEVTLEYGVDNRRSIALRGEFSARAGDRFASLCDCHEVDEADGTLRLSLQHPHQIGIVHRIERMILERALVQRRRANEQVTEIDGPPGLRKGRGHQSATTASLVAQSVRHRTDVAGVGRVERGADFVHHVPRAARRQPIIGGRGRLDRLPSLDRPDLKRDDNRFGVIDLQAGRGHADGLNGREAVAVERIREIGGARVVVGDSAQQERHVRPSCRA